MLNPPSVLIHDEPMPSTSEPLSLMVIDWEMAHLSNYSYDLGQLFAELFLLKHFRGIEASQWLISSFMKGYGEVDEELGFEIASLFGTHLIVWGSRVPGWGDKSAVEDCVKIGNEFVKHAFWKDIEWFRGGPLSSVFYSQ